MKAVVIHDPHDLRIDQIADAPAPGLGEVTVAMSHGGICGSDLHYYHHGGFGTVRIREPMALGHEVSGRIVAVGSDVAGLRPGDNVAVNPSRPCGQCEYCLKGTRNQCLDMRFNGSAMRFPHEQGLFRAQVTVPAELALRLSEGTDLALAAMCEPFAVCLHAVGRAGPLAGQRVLVSGCGPIGCLTVVAARLAGAKEIIATDLADAPLSTAAKLGADRVVNLSDTPDALAEYGVDKGQVDTVFECSGAGPAMRAAFGVARAGGLIVTVGLGGDQEIPISLLVTKELRLIGSFRFDAEFADAARLIDEGAVDLRPLLTAVLPMERAVEAFDLASDRTKAMKVQLQFG